MSVLLSLKGLRAGPNMKIGDADRRRSIDIPKWLWGTTGAPPTVLTGGPRSRMSEGLRQQNREVGLIVNPGEGRVYKSGKAVVPRRVDPGCQGAGLHMACQAPGITNCPHPLSPHRIKW